MDFTGFFTGIIDFAVTILVDITMIFFTPIDFLLSPIPGLQVIPDSITAISSFIGNLPGTIVSITGISPLLWNGVFTIFILYFTLTPSINLMKKIYNWIR